MTRARPVIDVDHFLPLVREELCVPGNILSMPLQARVDSDVLVVRSGRGRLCGFDVDDDAFSRSAFWVTALDLALARVMIKEGRGGEWPPPFIDSRPSAFLGYLRPATDHELAEGAVAMLLWEMRKLVP